MPAPREPVPREPVPRELSTTDCFDTVITRGLGEPRQVHYVVARRLRQDGLLAAGAEEYVEARERAEHLARSRRGPGRTSDDVAREVVALLDLPADAAPAVAAAEMDAELALTRAVPGAAALLAAERARGARLGFLSDTPMTAGQLRLLLERCGLIVEGDLVWTSSDLAAEKGEGEAYAAVVADLGGRPGRWLHRGDNRRSDVLMARLSGVEGSWAPAAALTGDERRLDRAAPATGGLSSVLAGASRRARLLLAEDGDADPRAGAVTGVLAPLLVGYALWALHRCAADPPAALRVTGPGSGVLLDVLTPLAAVVAPGLELRDDGAPAADELVLHSPGSTTGAGLHLVRTDDGTEQGVDPGPDDGAGARSGAWLRDDVAGTGSVEAGVEAALLVAALAREPHPGVVLAAREAAPLLALLPWSADLRGPVLAVAERLRTAPTPAEARAWALVPGTPAWPAARAAARSGAARTAARAAARSRGAGRLLRHKATRGGVLLRGRLAAPRPRGEDGTG
ncbi:HAD family hydrolase [Pseudokineococcus basanitobsidens]|uniref:HAD family hydrolase n=1 Tax=Pseudokineococcus basanitobsidens TaxID=1926649 RepID=A0ABU8RIW4_9ACTN